MLRDDFQQFFGTEKAHPKDFHSVQREPLIMKQKPGGIKIIQVCAISWLHVTIGIVNHSVSKLEDAVPEAREWPLVLHLHKESYHGSGYEGNECNKMLKNIPKLEEILRSYDKLAEGGRFVNVLKAFRDVKDIYSKDTVIVSALEEAVSRFKESWRNASLPLIPKAHLVFDHLVDFVILRDAKNMYQLSEQSHESLHHEFDLTWRKYAIKETSNPNYKEHLFRAVCDFNGSHAK